MLNNGGSGDDDGIFEEVKDDGDTGGDDEEFAGSLVYIQAENLSGLYRWGHCLKGNSTSRTIDSTSSFIVIVFNLITKIKKYPTSLYTQYKVVHKKIMCLVISHFPLYGCARPPPCMGAVEGVLPRACCAPSHHL